MKTLHTIIRLAAIVSAVKITLAVQAVSFAFGPSIHSTTTGTLNDGGVEMTYLNPIGNNNNRIDAFANGIAFDNGFNNDLQSVDFTFDTQVRFDSYVVGDQAHGGGSLNVRLNGIIQEAVDVSSLGSQNLTTPFVIGTGQTLTLQNVVPGTDEFAISSLSFTVVPEPQETVAFALLALGAFVFARRFAPQAARHLA